MPCFMLWHPPVEASGLPLWDHPRLSSASVSDCSSSLSRQLPLPVLVDKQRATCPDSGNEGRGTRLRRPLQSFSYEMTMSYPSIVVIGFTCRDTNILPDGTTQHAVGGKAYYMALALHRLGVPTYVVTWVAERDRDLLDPYLDAGIPVWNIPVEHSVEYVNRYLDPEGNMREQEARAPAFSLHLPKIPADALTAIGAAHTILFGTDHEGVVTPTFLEHLRTATKARFAIDFGTFLRRIGPDRTIRFAPTWPEHLPYGVLDIAMLSSEDLPRAYHDDPPDLIARTLVQRGIREMLLTLGSRGSVLATDVGTDIIPSFPVRIVDPTGAGDTYFAAYLAERLRSQDPYHCARFASAAAALSITRQGPLDASREDIEALMDA